MSVSTVGFRIGNEGITSRSIDSTRETVVSKAMNNAHSTLTDILASLRCGELVGMPTETVYGLAGDATRSDVVAKIYALKNRPDFNPLIAHVATLEAAMQQACFSATALKLAEVFWPGPLTLVLPVAESNTVCELARSGLDTQAVRCPAHPVALELLNRLDKPLAAPSANKSGRISPTTAEHVRREFGTDLSHILDGGAAVKGLESTVLSVIEDEVTLLRPGSLSTEDITTIIGPVRSALHDDTAPRSPGMLSRHYAPEARLRLNADRAKSEDEAFLGFGPADCRVTLNLSPTCDMTEAASNLYAMLRSLDEQYAAIAVANIPETGLGEAINDRLRRAAL